MKICKTTLTVLGEFKAEGVSFAFTYPRYILGRNVGFTDWDFNRTRENKKNCVLDYKLMCWDQEGSDHA